MDLLKMAAYRALVNLDNRLRVQEDISEETIEVDEIKELLPVLKIGKAFQKVVKTAGKGKNKDKGPPHIWYWSGLVRQIATAPHLSAQGKQCHFAQFIVNMVSQKL